MSGDGAETFRRSTADAYDGHVGRYGSELARGLIGLAGVGGGDRVLDVGCGTGLLTAELAAVVGADRVAAVDPSEPFVEACRQRVPGADVRLAAAEDLPFADATFDGALSQLVVNFMGDAEAGVGQMRRVTRPGGTVAACVWDYAGGMTLLRTFWDAAVALDPAAAPLDEGVLDAPLPARQPAGAVGVGRAAGDHGAPSSRRRCATRASRSCGRRSPRAWRRRARTPCRWTTTAGGLSGEEFHRRLGSPDGPFVLTARAWAVVGRR